MHSTALHLTATCAPHPLCSDERQRALQQEAWNMANDSLRTTLCVRFRAEAVACGILFTAARKLQVGAAGAWACWRAWQGPV